ncbi:MAG: hypothetical protein M0C28_34430 [Candidatus Moduliflexus flocculans]|nr:hypothetical protein [Candidatus Moduliflexus flocculans]
MIGYDDRDAVHGASITALPGIAADISILIYAVIAVCRLQVIRRVTLTLPGIAGIMLSTGAALDANILDLRTR